MGSFWTLAEKQAIEKADEFTLQAIKRYKELLKEEEIVRKRGYQINDYCWNCKKFFKKLNYKICANGFISYWCKKCY